MARYKFYNDESLMQLIGIDDEAAFTELYDRYWDKLFTVGANKLKDLALAEELVQDIFLDIWGRRSQIRISGIVGGYLATALKYKIIDTRQKLKRLREYEYYASKKLSLADYSTENQLSFEELKERLAALVARLPEKCRIVYKLSKEEGYSQKEIASVLSISEKTVESQLSRAIKYLRTSLNQGLSSFMTLFLL